MHKQSQQLDGLTQAYHRNAWLELAQQRLTTSSQPGVLLFIDLDRFKFVTDALGHEIGDEVLRKVVELIRPLLHLPDDLLGRIGGDEFVVLLTHPGSVAEAEQIATAMIERIAEPLTVQMADVEIGASIGIARYPQDSQQLNELMKFADLAMYRAKHSGRNQWVRFQPQMIEKIHYRRDVQAALRKALKHEQLELRFQLVVDQRLQQPVAVETMVDLESDDTLSRLDQEVLFAIADESQVSIQLSEWMLHESLSALKNTQGWGVPLQVVVPVRARHFHQAGFVETLTALLASLDMPAENLILKLNEACLNVQRFAVETQLQKLSKMGVQLAIENYGTGNLSLLKLHDWPLDPLFLSTAFVNELTHSRSMQSMTTALIEMGKMLNKTVIACGVCSAEQQAFLLSQHCDWMQGPFCGEPLTEQELEATCLDGLRD